MKKIVTLCFLLALVCVKGWGQTVTAINPATDGGFELGTTFADNGWATAMTGNNLWYLGGVAKTVGSKGAYIDANGTAGTANTYNMGTSRVNYIYKDVPIPIGATNIILNFKWRAVGENGTGADSWDFLRVFLVPNTTTITGGTLLSSGSIIGLGKYNLSSATTFSTAAPITIPNSAAGTTQRLAFCWVNDGSGGTNPPAAVDEISLTYTAPPPTLTATALAAFGAQCINGTYGPNSFTISGVSLTTAPVTVAALSGYTYATTSAGPYSSSLSLTQPGGNFSQQIFVQFSPTLVQSYNGTISVGGGGASSISVTASGSGVNTAPTATSGAASSVTYNSATVAGSLTAGCSTISAYGIEYSTSPGFANGSGTPVASPNLSGGAFSSNLTGLTGSTPYYFHAYATPTSGSTVYGAQGTFTTLATPPANDNCATAFTITPGVSCVATSGTNVNATQQYAPAVCSGSTSSSALDVWYQFTADGSSSYTISVTGSGNSTTGFDPVLQLFSGCSTSNAISCIDASDRAGTETIAAGVLAAGTYYYRIYGWNGSTGTFTTCVTAPLTYKDLWISMNVGSTTWCAGETRNVTVTVKNNGTATWTTSSPTINVGVKWNTNGSNWADYYVRVSANNLAPGAQTTYTLPITASNNTGSGYTTPLAAGTNNLTFDVVEEGVSWFGDNGGNTGPGNVVFKSANLTINALPQGSLTGNTICAGGTGQLTFTATAGTGPFTVVYNDGTGNQTANNVVSGTAFSPATNPTATTTYTLVSVTNSATGGSCATTSGFTGGTATITVNTPPTVSNPSDQTTCAGTSKTFSVTATGTSPAYQWQYLNGATWTNLTNTTIGTITYSNTTTATMTAAPSGTSTTSTYQYRCIVSVASCSSVTSAAATFTVNATPTASASSNTPVCAGSTLNLTGTTNGTSFAWTGPNGFSSTLQNPSITNVTTANAGSYSFTATANGCPSATVSTTVAVNTPPSIGTGGQPTSQATCAGTAKIFTVSNVSGTSPTYQWQYSSTADGSSGWANVVTGTPPNITYTNPTTASLTVTPSASAASGTYYYRCQINVNNCSSVYSSTASLTVNATPTASASANTPVCAGSTLNLTGTSNGTTFAWTGPNGFSSTLQNPSIANVTAAAAGSYSFTATANGCPSATVSTTVVVNTPPTVSNPSNAIACTSGSAVLFTVTATGTSPTYQWQYSADGTTYNPIANGTVGGFTFSGATSNQLSVTAGSGAAAGTYYIKCVVSVSGCATPATSNPATLTVVPAPTITTQPVSPTVCAGSPLTLSVTASNATGYQWKKGGTNINGATSSTYTIASAASTDAGNYTVTVSGASPCGSVTSNTATVTVKAAFTGVAASATPNPICLGSSSQLLATSSTVQSYGYTAISSPSPTTGTPIAIAQNSFSSLDDGFVTVPIPFGFRLYGTSYPQLSVSINGYVMFNSGANKYTGTAIPNSDFPNPTIALVYSDLLLSSSQGEIDTFTVGTAPNRKFIIKWNNVGFYNASAFGTIRPPTGSVTGQIELNESDNDFDLFIDQVTGAPINSTTTFKATGVQYSSTEGIGVTGKNGTNWTQSSLVGYHFSDVTYTWAPATNLSATNIANPVATPIQTTQYTVTGTNNGGCTATSSVTVTVNANTNITLASAAGTDAQTVCAASPITPITYQVTGSGTLNASIPGGILPPGVTGSFNSTTNVYTISGTPGAATSGSFPYTITATGGCASKTISGTININALPAKLNFTSAGVQYYCTDADGTNGDGFDVSIDASETGVHYQLLYNATTIVADSVGHSGSGIDFGDQFATGTYTVKGINSTTGCNQIVTNSPLILSTKQRPEQYDMTVGGIVTTTASACQGNTLVFGTSASQNGATYRLYRNNVQVGSSISGNSGGTAISFPPTVINANGTYKITSVTGTCGTVTMNNQVVVTVLSRPTPTFVPASPSGSYCSSQNSIIYTTQSGQSNYVWSVPGTAGVDYNITAGGISSTDNTVTITWLTTSNTSSTKTITVNYDNSNGCNGLTAATSTITINPTPTIANKTTTAACSGLFSVTPTNSGGDIVPVGTTYSWSAPTTPGITGTASGTNQSSISGTLTNTTNSPITVVYNVTATVGSCSSSFTVSVTVNPVPSITAKTTTAACNGSFTVTPTNGGSDIVPTGTTYSWSAPTGTGFNGGAIGSGSAIAGTLTNTTNATVTAVYTVTPTSGTCTGSTFTVTVSVKAVSNISNQTTTVCSGSLFTVTPATGGVNIVPAGTTYSWGVPTMSAGVSGGVAGGGNSISGMLTYSGATTGTAIYTVTPVSGSGCTGNNSFTVTVTINALPVAVVSADNPYACAGTGGSFTITGTPNSTVSYNLNGGSGTSKTLDGSGNGTVPVGIISSSVTITLTSVSASAATGGCSSTPAGAGSTATITTAPLPTEYTVSGGGNYCQGGIGDTITLSGSQTGVTYTLLLNGSPTSATAPGTGFAINFINVTTPGAYKVLATNNTTGCQKTTGSSVMVGYYTQADITTDAAPAMQTVCQNGTPTDLTVTAVGNNLVYQWYSNTTSSTTGGTAITSTNSSSYTPSTATVGTVYYYVTVTGPCRTVTSRVVSVTVASLPDASISPDHHICTGDGSGVVISSISGGTVYYHINNSTTALSVSVPVNSGVTLTDVPAANTTYTLDSVKSGAGCVTFLNATSMVTLDVAPTLALASGSGAKDQPVCKTTPIINITFTAGGGATGITVTNLPSGLTAAPATGTTVTISGTPTATGTYTVATTGGTCSPVSITGTITLLPISWTGTIDNDWNKPGNWCSGSIPTAIDDVVIGTVNPRPVLSADATAHNLDIQLNYTVDLSGHTLTVTGSLTGAGSLTGSASSSLTSGGGGTVNFTQTTPGTTNVLQNLAVTGGTLTLSNALNITAGNAAGVVTVSGTGQLATGNNLTLKSDVNGTASVGEHTGTSHITDYITGNVTTERFTNAGVTAGKRAWRLVTSPVTGQTISQAWQEGQVYDATSPSTQTGTYGTIITGEKMTSGTAANGLGYDYVGGGNNASLKHYVTGGGANGADAWLPLPATVGTRTTNVRDEQAYMLFIRGDRTKNTPTAVGVDNLRATGTLLQGPQTISVPLANALTLVGNPYAAPLNFAQLYAANSSVIQDQFYAWDAHLGNFGGYVTVSGNNGVYTATPSQLGQTGTVSVTQYIQSGQGFLVTPNNGGTLTIGESMKNTTSTVSTTISASPFRVVPSNIKQIRVNLNVKTGDTSANLADGFLARFDDYYSDAAAQQEGTSRKAWNFNENLNLVWGGKAHIIEARADVQKTDTLFMQMWNVTRRSYQLQMKADNFTSAPGVQAWLVDSYLGTKQELSLSGSITTVDFAVNSDSLSSKTNRFMIVFQNNAVVLPVTLTSIKASPQNGGVNVSWTVTNEVNIKGYTVERSTDGGRTYTAIATQPAKNATAASVTNYTSFDNLPEAGDNLYRIRIEAKDGTTSYSGIVKITIGEGNGSIQIAVYPNPVRDGKVSLQLSNLKAGAYLVAMYSEGGQTVYQKKITISQSNTTQSEELRLGKALAQGSYQLRLTDNKGNTLKVTKLIVAY